jgi:mRNA interferase MazF
MAVEHFLQNHETQMLLGETGRNDKGQSNSNESIEIPLLQAAERIQRGVVPKEIRQGGVYWVPLEESDESESTYMHPHVVIQDDILNRSRIHTAVFCALTTNMKRAKAPGNVLLEAGEANLPKQSVVVVSQVSVVDKTQIGEYIGSLSEQRIQQILAGMRFLQSFTERRETGEEKPGMNEEVS